MKRRELAGLVCVRRLDEADDDGLDAAAHWSGSPWPGEPTAPLYDTHRP